MSELVVPLDARSGNPIFASSISSVSQIGIALQSNLALTKYLSVLSNVEHGLDIIRKQFHGAQTAYEPTRDYTVSDSTRLAQLVQQFPGGITASQPAKNGSDPNTELDHKLQAAIAERDNLQQQLAEMERQHVAAKSDLQSQIAKNGELSHAAALVDTTTKELRNTRDLLNRGEDALKALQDRITDETTKRSIAEAERDTTKDQLVNANTQLDTLRGELDRLKNEHATVQGHHEQARHLVDQHRAEADKLRSDLDARASELVDYGTSRGELESKLRESETRASELEAARAQLETSLTASRAKIDELTNMVQSGIVDINRARDDLARAHIANGKALQSLRDTYEPELARLKQELTDAGTTGARDTDALRERVQRLEGEVESLNANITRCDSERADCQTRLAACEANSQEVQTQSNAQVNVLTGQVQTLTTQIAELQRERNELRTQVDQLTVELQNARASQTRSQDASQTHVDTIRHHEDTIQRHASKIQELNDKINALRAVNQKLEAVKDGVDRLIAENGITVIASPSSNTEIDQLRTWIGEQLQRLHELGVQRDQLIAGQTHLHDLQDANTRLRQREIDLTTKMNEHVQQHAEKDRRMDELQLQLQAVRQQLTDNDTTATARYTQLQADFDAQKLTLTNITNTGVDLQNQLQALRATNTALQDTIDTLQAPTNTAAALQQQVDALQRENARLQALPAQVVAVAPAAGSGDDRCSQLEAENRELRERLLHTGSALENTEYVIVEHERRDSDLVDQRRVLQELMGKIPRLASQASGANLYSSEMALDRIKRLRKSRPELKLLHNWYNARPWYQRLMLEELDLPDYARGILERGEASVDEMNNWYRLYN